MRRLRAERIPTHLLVLHALRALQCPVQRLWLALLLGQLLPRLRVQVRAVVYSLLRPT